MKKRVPESKILNLDSALILGYITFMGYFIAYIYQKTYFDYFKIPSVFLQNISINTIIIAIISFSGFLGILMLVYHVLNEMIDSTDNPIIQRIKVSIPFILIAIAVKIYFKTKIIIYIGLAIFLISCIYNFVFPLLLVKTKGYKNKLRRFHFTGNQTSFRKILYYTYKKKPLAFLALVLSGSFFIGVSSFVFAYENANTQNKFAVTKIDDAEYIVFEIQSDKAIIAELKRDEIIPKYKKVEIENLFIEKKTFNKLKLSK
ncbi:hypothetical protein P4T97_18570 [Bacillus paralicheniformis]|uniref:hypothetical protein n=1 Tax=Bacillus paralicheniformis TaxID=1648923 RepID=UPI002E20E83A|nr:hypothetical protein [Bacillus paralicheniformis]